MRTISFKISERLDEVLSDMARRQNVSRSSLVRAAVESLAAGQRRSVTVLVDELVPSFDAPTDLSTSSKYMAAYGK